VDYSRAIRIGRALADMSQRDLAERISVDATLVSMFETGRRQPTLETLTKIADELQIPFHLFTLLASEPREIRDADPATVRRLALALSKLLLSGGHLEPKEERGPGKKARHSKSKASRRHS
jgi:transcriptional regulator with XRE-family HTH domain